MACCHSRYDAGLATYKSQSIRRVLMRLKRSSAGAVQAVCNGPSMSAAHCTTVHDGLLHPHLRYCLLAASALRWLPSAVGTATPAFDVRSSTRRAFPVAGPAAWNSLPDYLRDPPSSFDSFRRDLKTFLVLLAYTAH